MKLYYITHQVEMKTGGEIYNMRLVNGLIARGYQVEIFSDRDIPRVFRSNFLLYNIFYLIRFYYLKDCGLLVDSYLHPRFFFALCFLKIFTNVRVTGTVHHLYWMVQSWELIRQIDKFFESHFIRMFDFLIVPSKFTLTEVQKLMPSLPKVKIIKPGFEFNPEINMPKKIAQKKNNCPAQILCVANIQERKGFEYLIEAVAELDQINLIIIGDTGKRKKYYQFLLNQIHLLNIINRVQFLGHVDEKSLIQYYQNSDIFVLPTLHEGYGIVILEAMSHGLPVIATNICSIPEIITHNWNGILVPPKDSRRLSEAIQDLMDSPEKRQRLKSNGLKFILDHPKWSDIINQWDQYFNKILCDSE
jgi:glycosyltransferase involved in cell wall biosynthesis